MSFLLWGVVGFLFGLCIFICTGPLLAPQLPDQWRQRLGDFYAGQALMSLDRAILARRKHGGYDLFASSYDVENESEKTKIGGKTRHFEDPRGLISNLHKRTFGLVDERYNVFVDPLTADVASRVHRYTDDEKHMVVLEDESGQAQQTCFTRYMPMSVKPRNVDIAKSVHMLSGSASADLTTIVEEFVKRSQEGFKRADLVFLGSLMMMFVVGFGAVAMVYYLGLHNAGGGSSTTIGLFTYGGWL